MILWCGAGGGVGVDVAAGADVHIGYVHLRLC